MSQIILVTGGARSGKSSHAEARTRSFPGERIYVATSRGYDDEMRDRIDRHIADRGDGWTTIEEPVNLAEVLDQTDQRDAPLAKIHDAQGNPMPETGSVRGTVTGSFFHMIATTD